MIECTKCGACCTQLGRHALYAELDRGDGVCWHFEEVERTCRIYATRPEICQSEKMYQRYFSHMSREDFVAINQQLCEQAKSSQSFAPQEIFFRT